jgi:hypothetical protein
VSLAQTTGARDVRSDVVRIADGGGPTGILLLDRARINRYDIAVPVFGLLALWVFNRAEVQRSRALYLAAGLLIGLASLSHLYGMFWLPALATMLLIRRRSRLLSDPACWLLLAGVAITWLPWLAYIASGWSDFAGQMRFVSPRFDLLNPSFFTRNVFHGGGPLSLDWLLRSLADMPPSRISTWSALAGLPIALAAIVFRSPRAASADHAALPHGESVARLSSFSYTIAHNLSGCPGAVVRCGESADGLPIGVQVVAAPWKEHVALAVAAHLERACGGWKQPPL